VRQRRLDLRAARRGSRRHGRPGAEAAAEQRQQERCCRTSHNQYPRSAGILAQTASTPKRQVIDILLKIKGVGDDA
jgi:hypothetical protein